MLPSLEPQHCSHTDRVGLVTRAQPTLKASSTLEMRNVARTAATAWFLFAHRFYVNVVMIAQVRNVTRTAATARFLWTTVLSLISWFSFGREITVDF